ncbi:syntaxin-72-like isoform X2 [Chenopodium quinoa]|uniref:syntaxin-72-like isoform X2 n=1 Tax=Chenopodium quinoa TaxID=63459 RepID=UPI000B783500|nr:syntaxin-72-like isoform X2 [Chenopodium quinoa]
MSVIQILFRVDEICKKYEKYDVDKQRERNATGDDAFARLYDTIESDIEKVIHKSEIVARETNRAKAVAMNAEIRRTKARLLEDVAKLQKLAYKKVKGLSKDDMVARGDLAIALGERIQGIPDGGNNAKNDGWASSSNPNNIKFDMQVSDTHLNDGFFQETGQLSQFRQEYEMRKLKQDEGLDIISEGLETLKNLAHDMNEELDRQVPLVDEIDTKVDKANTDLKNNNVRLKQTLHQIRSSRNFCIDIILLCVILGIAAYLYK